MNNKGIKLRPQESLILGDNICMKLDKNSKFKKVPKKFFED